MTSDREGLAATRGRLEEHARAMSDALLVAVPLGGSECFVSVDGVFYADPKFIGERIKEIKDTSFRLKLEIMELRKQLTTPPKAAKP
jgi:aspartokinase